MDLLTVTEAAKIAGKHESTIRRACAGNALPCQRVGARLWLIAPDDLQRWMDNKPLHKIGPKFKPTPA